MKTLAALVAVLAPLLHACDSSTEKKDSGPAPSTFAEQVSQGRAVFGEHCARCHGDAGQGSKKAPPLVGAGALPRDPRPDQERKQPFRTAADVASFVTHNMPPDEDDRDELSERDYWAVLAFALQANGVQHPQPVSPSNAASIVLHP